MKKLLAVLFAAVLLFSACGGGTASGTGDASSAGQPAAEGSSAPAADGGSATGNMVELDGIQLSTAYSGTTVSFLCAPTPWTTPLIEMIPEFEAATGITVDVQQMPDTQLSSKISVGMSTGGADLDVFAYRPLQEVKQFIKNGWLQDLNSYIESSEGYDFEDFTEAGREINSQDGKVYGIPNISERTTLFYQTERFADAGLTEAPKTFDELEQYCQALTDAANGQYALALRGEGSAAVTQFAAFLRGFGGDFVTDGKAAINSPEAIEALQFYGKLIREYSSPGAINFTAADSVEFFFQDRAAMYIDGDVHYAEILDPELSLVTDKVSYAMFPEGPAGQTPCGIISWSVGISSGSQKQEASWEFVKWATSKGVDLKIAQQRNMSTRVSTWEAPVISEIFPAELVAIINETNPIANPVDRPFIIAGGEARSIVAELITAAIENREDLQALADDANARFQALIDKEA